MESSAGFKNPVSNEKLTGHVRKKATPTITTHCHSLFSLFLCWKIDRGSDHNLQQGMEIFFAPAFRSIAKLSSYAIFLVSLLSCSLFTSTGDDPDATFHYFSKYRILGAFFLFLCHHPTFR